MKIFLISIIFWSLCVAGGCASTPDFGITPEHPEDIAAAITRASQERAKKLVIPPGVYRIPRPENCVWHIDLDGIKDLEIEATGVTFLIEGRDRRAMRFHHCENVTLRGLTIDREVPPFSQGKIEAIADDRASVDVRLDKGYPTDIDDARYFGKIPVFDVYKPGTRELKPLVPDIYIASVERLGPDLFRFHCRSAIQPQIPVAVGDPVAFRAAQGVTVNLWDTAKMKIENITILNGQGISFMELCGDGGNQYINCRVTYGAKPKGATEEPLLSSGADGFNSGLTRHGPTLDHCLFEGMNDDGTNIRGGYAMLMEAAGNKVILAWRSPHKDDAPEPTRPGDTLLFYDRNVAYLDEAVTVDCKRLKDYESRPLPGPIVPRRYVQREFVEYFEVTLDRAVKAEFGGGVSDANRAGSGFAIRNCIYRNHRGHGIFLRASNGVIENCTLEGIMMGGIVVGPELCAFSESDYARNVIIRGNTLRNVATASQLWNRAITVAAWEYNRFVPRPGGHRNILIEDNTLENNRGANVVVTSADGVKIRHNRFVNPMAEPPFNLEKEGVGNDGALIWVRESENVTLDGNIISNPGPYFNGLLDADDSVKDPASAFAPASK